MKQALTTTPTALASLNDNTRYTLQYPPLGGTMYVEIGDTVPTDESGAFVARGGQLVYVEKGAGEEVYVWTEKERGGHVVYLEAV